MVNSLPSSPLSREAVQPRTKLVRRLGSASLRVGVLLVAAFLVVCASRAQDEKPKLPGLDKIISANEHLMFTGKVKSVDEKHNVLSVSSVEGEDTEIFPIKHGTHVLTADGFRKKLDVLSPGTPVDVFYDQRNDRRTVTSIQLHTSEDYRKKEPHS